MKMRPLSTASCVVVACPGVTVLAWQTPLVQLPPRQSCPQRPQFAASLCTSAQALPQATLGAVQEHESALHSAPPLHAPAQQGVPGTPHDGLTPESESTEPLLAAPLLAAPLVLLPLLLAPPSPAGGAPTSGSSPTHAEEREGSDEAEAQSSAAHAGDDRAARARLARLPRRPFSRVDRVPAVRYQPGSLRAHNSAVECDLHTVEVGGSSPSAPTIYRPFLDDFIGPGTICGTNKLGPARTEESERQRREEHGDQQPRRLPRVASVMGG